MVISILDGVVKNRIQQRKVQYKKNTLISDLVIYSVLCRNILDRKLKFPAGHLGSVVQRFRGSEVVRHHINPMESIGKEKVRST